MRGRKKNDDTRTAILQCAAEVFSQREFHEVLTDDIAVKLGIGKGTLYRHFESKEDLYFATITTGLEAMHTAIGAVMREEAPLERSIERLVRTMLEYFWQRRDFFLLLNRMEPKLDPSERQLWQQRREELLGLVSRVVERELPKSARGRAHSRLAVEMLFGMIRAICLYRGPHDTVDALSRLVTETFIHGIGDASRPRLTGARRRPLRMVVHNRRKP